MLLHLPLQGLERARRLRRGRVPGPLRLPPGVDRPAEGALVALRRERLLLGAGLERLGDLEVN